MRKRKPTQALRCRLASAACLGVLAACGGTGAPSPRAAPQEPPGGSPVRAEITRPIRIFGQRPGYTQEALEAKVEGLMIVKCVIRTSGEVTDCRAIKSLPYLEQSTLDTLERWRMTPVTYKGRPVAVDYVFNLRFRLPAPPPVPPAP
ncbi:energy transducer TonB [Sorangium sp. So ce118]